MITVQQLLKQKENPAIISVQSNTIVYDAIKIMGAKNIGALLVIDNDVLVGIFSERDYARKIVLQNKTSRGTVINEVMTMNVITVSLSNTIEDCMTIMNQSKIRHLPIIEDLKVIGIISISDIVSAIIAKQNDTIKYLHQYITT